MLEIIELTLWSQSRLIKVCLEQNPCCDVVPMQKGGSEGCKAETVLKILKQNPSDTRANQTLMHEHIGGFRSRAGVVSGLQWRDDHEFIKTAIFRETNPRIFLLKPPFFSACLQGGDREDRINPAVHVNNKHTSLIRRFLYSHKPLLLQMHVSV